MVKYKKVYCEALGFDRGDFIPCEITGSPAIDFHHVVNREDRIENLMALTRSKHVELGDKKHHMVYLLETHRIYLQVNRVEFEDEWFDKWINHYKNLVV